MTSRHALVRPEIPCRDRRRVAEDLARALRRKHSAEDPVAAADHRAPAGGAVGVRHLLHDTEEGRAARSRRRRRRAAPASERRRRRGGHRPRLAGIARVRSTTAHSSRIICVSEPTAETGSAAARAASLCVLMAAPLWSWPQPGMPRRASMSELAYLTVEVQRSRWRTAYAAASARPLSSSLESTLAT